MNKVKTGLLAASALAVVGTVGIVGVNTANAQSDSNNSPMSGLVEKLATKFNLNKADVQKVFDENHQEREAKRAEDQSTRLQKLVDAGTITADQKTKIEAKFKELQTAREADRGSLKDLTKEERKAKMDAQRTELEAWAKDNGIDVTKLQGIFMKGVNGRHMGPPKADMQ